VLQSDGASAARDELAQVQREVGQEDHTFSRCYAESILAAACQAVGDAEGALCAARAALRISRDGIFNYWKAWSRIVEGWAMAQLGEHEQGVATLRRGIDEYAATGSRQILPYALTLLADALRASGSIDEGLEILEEVEALQSGMTVAFHSGVTARVTEALRRAGSP
jgi:tetratricopeptide (TPR) repeat protein